MVNPSRRFGSHPLTLHQSLQRSVETNTPKPESTEGIRGPLVRRGMRGQGAGWRGSDAGEMDDAEYGGHAREMLAACGSGAGSHFQRRPQAVTVRGPAWALTGEALGVVDR